MIRITLITNNPRKTVIAEETKTVKQILNENDVSYASAATALDGATLSAAEMNQTLSQLGVTERAVISVLAHKDNAMNAVIQGSACVITSALTAEQIKRFKKYHPEWLTLYEEDDPIFAIGYDPEGPGSIDGNGAMFGSAADAEGHATITVMLNPAEEDLEKLVSDRIGRALLKLKDLEEMLVDELADLDAEEAAIRAAITRV